MTWLIKVLFFFLCLTLLQRILAKLFGPRLRTRRQPRPAGPTKTVSGQTVKDPQCGMYVATNLAIATRKKGDTFYFCSEKCRDEFLRAEKQDKFHVSGSSGLKNQPGA